MTKKMDKLMNGPWLEVVEFLRNLNQERLDDLEDCPTDHMGAFRQASKAFIRCANHILKGLDNPEKALIRAHFLGVLQMQVTICHSLTTIPAKAADDIGSIDRILTAMHEITVKDAVRKFNAGRAGKKAVRGKNAIRDENLCTIGQHLQKKGVKDRNLKSAVIKHCFRNDLWEGLSVDPLKGLTVQTVGKVLKAGDVLS